MKRFSNSRRRTGAILLAVLACSGVFIGPVQAGVIVLHFSDAATARDNGPQDGVFDQFEPLDLGAIDNNGWTSYRTALEFDLRALPAGARIDSASLSAYLNSFELLRPVALNGYAGDGTVQLGDFALDGLLGTQVVGPMPGPLSFDVTGFLRNLGSSGAALAGFNFREDPPDLSNYGVMRLLMDVYNAPALSVNYTIIPEPSALALSGFGLALLLRRLHELRPGGLSLGARLRRSALGEGPDRGGS